MAIRTRTLTILWLAIVLLSTWPAAARPTGLQPHYVLDLSDAEIGFSVSVLGLFRVTGRFDHVQGGLLFSESCMARSVAFRIQTASASTNNQLRDRIIRGPQLLNSQEYPFIAFTSTRILSGRDGPGEIQGELSMNGNTRPVRFLIAPSPQSENDTQPAAAYRAVASISRDDFGIPSPMIGTSDTVHIQVSLELREEALQFASANRQEMTP